MGVKPETKEGVAQKIRDRLASLVGVGDSVEAALKTVLERLRGVDTEQPEAPNPSPESVHEWCSVLQQVVFRLERAANEMLNLI